MGGVAIVLFSDLVDSTALLAMLGDDRMEEVRRAHVEDVSRAVGDAGGRLVKTLGDGAMASFESALGALRAAAAIQAAVERLDAAHGGIGVAARVGVAAGEPIPDGEDLHGMTVVIASRLSSVAGSGDVLVQDLVQALVASRDGVALEGPEEYELKGVPAPVRAARLLWRELVADGVEVGAAEGAAVAAGVRLPPTLAAYAEEPLIGRDREIAELRETTAPRPGRYGVLILGEPGIGKTRHAAATASEAHASGAVVVLARCPPEPTIAFEPWVRAIGELALAGDEAWRQALAEAAGAELSALVPELSEHATLADRAAAGEVVEAEGARYRLLRGIGAVFARAAGEAPLHIVLDDAHWCDPASAQALERLLESAPCSAMALVVTARDRELGRRHPVSRALADLRRTGDLGELRLDGLDASGLAALVGARVGRAITPRLAERLLSRTAGNPFFAGELARDLDAQGALREGEALESVPASYAVTGLVEERLGRLDPDTERLLCAVAAIGPTARVELAARAAGLDPDAAERAVREAVSERLVDSVAAAEPTIAFPHALVREALIAGIDEADRAGMHLSIARALEAGPEAEPADLARHYGNAVELTGPEPAVAAYRAAAATAAGRHDHEQAAAHMRSALSLLPEGELSARAKALLELGEQELLSADMMRGRASFRDAIENARLAGDAVTLARAALGFAGGDVGFGWEAGTDDPATVELLREGIEALGEDEPRLALRLTFRLTYLLLYTDDDEMLSALVRRAAALAERLGDVEATLAAESTRITAGFARSPELPPDMHRFDAEVDRLVELAEECGREDLFFRVVQISAGFKYAVGDIRACEAAVERAAEIAARLGAPRFAWEVDFNRSMRLMDRGDPDAAEILLRRAGAVVRRLRPDMHFVIELAQLTIRDWYYGGDVDAVPLIYEAMERVAPRGLVTAASAATNVARGDLERGRRQLWSLLGDDGDLESLRRPDAHMPSAVCLLSHAAAGLEDREAAARLLPLLKPLRGTLPQAVPMLDFGQPPEWPIGRLQTVLGGHDEAVSELRRAVELADELELAWARAWIRIDLAVALHRRGGPEDAVEVEAVRREGEALAERYGIGWASRCAAELEAEIDGRPSPSGSPGEERSRPLRALATRGGRRALAAMARGHDDPELERRFVEPRRQRALVRAMARGFQPGWSGGFSGTIAFELEPGAIEAPPEAPWRWALEVDTERGRARLVEPAPLEAAVTIHFRLADWVRVVAGIEDPLIVMAAGRGSVEGDVRLATRLEGMFGGV